MRRRAAVVIVFSALLLVVPSVHATAARGTMVRAGTLPLTFGDGLVADTATRRLIAIEGGAQPLSLSAYDGDSLRRVRHATFSQPVWPQAGRAGRAGVYALDEKARRLHILVYETSQTKDNTANPSILSVDANTLRVVGKLTAVAPPGVRVLGMRLRPNGRAMLILQTIPTVAPPLLFPVESPRVAGVILEEIDLSSGARTWGPAAIRGCQSPITNQSQTTVAFHERTVFVGCATSQVLNVAGPGVAAIAAVNLDDPTDQRLSFLPGSYSTGDIAVDERASRLLPISSAAEHPNQAVWVYDLAHRTFVGQVAAGEADIFGAAVEPSSGRLYVAINNALLVTSDRGNEIAQALSFPMDTNIGALTPIPFNRGVVVPVHGPKSSWVFAVYRDKLPDAFSPGATADLRSLDELTTDEPQFAAGAQAFGVRIHTIGGANSLLQNILPQGGNYWSQAGNVTQVKDGDRDVTFARVIRAHLSEGEASAEATAGDPDPNTASDYVTIARRVPESVLSPKWPYESRGCRDFGDGSAGEPGVSCSLSKGAVTAEAAHDAVPVPGVLTVGSSGSRGALRLDAARQLIAVIHAEARDVRIGTSVRLGEVSSDVSVAASGAAGKARATYTRTFKNVTAGDFHCDATCDPTAVLAALTDTLGTQFRVELPGEESLATPGGSHAHAIREAWEHQQDVVLNNQDPTQQQVAALRLTYINDGTLASRAIIELAATGADATNLRVVTRATPVIPSVAPGIPQLIPPRITVVPPTLVSPPPVAPVVERVLGHGWRLLTTGGPGMVVRGIALWALLAAPAFFATRRRLLVRMRTQ